MRIQCVVSPLVLACAAATSAAEDATIANPGAKFEIVHRAPSDDGALAIVADGTLEFTANAGRTLRFDPGGGKVVPGAASKPPAWKDAEGRGFARIESRWTDDAGRTWFVHEPPASAAGETRAPPGVYRSAAKGRRAARVIADSSARLLAVAALESAARVVVLESAAEGGKRSTRLVARQLGSDGVVSAKATSLADLGDVRAGRGLALDIDGRVYVPVRAPEPRVAVVDRQGAVESIVIDGAGEPLACAFGIGEASTSLFVRTSEALLRVPLRVTGENPGRLELLRTFRGEFIRIRPGTEPFPQSFVRGRSDGPATERPAADVSMTREFSIAAYEVPQNLWQAVTGENPSRWKGPRNSVELMTWREAVAFCEEATGLMRAASLIEADELVRLPSEAEWEYCARAGTTTIYSFGDDDAKLGEYAWFTGNAAGNDPPVGVKKPNAWRLYDVHGYLWEMCADAWQPSHDDAPADGSPRPAAGDAPRVARGGSWKDASNKLTSTFRQRIAESTRDDALGLRCVLARKR